MTWPVDGENYSLLTSKPRLKQKTSDRIAVAYYITALWLAKRRDKNAAMSWQGRVTRSTTAQQRRCSHVVATAVSILSLSASAPTTTTTHLYALADQPTGTLEFNELSNRANSDRTGGKALRSRRLSLRSCRFVSPVLCSVIFHGSQLTIKQNKKQQRRVAA